MKALAFCNMDSVNYQRNRTRKRFADENRDSEDKAVTNSRKTFRTSVYIKIIDNMTGQLRHRMGNYCSLGTRFEIFKDLHDKDPHKINVEAERLAESYPNDFDIDSLINECLHSQGYMKLENIKYLKECFAYISNNDLKSTFPNLEIAMRIFLSIPVTSCSAEIGNKIYYGRGKTEQHNDFIYVK
ncbi:unnamed protein product [Psylliodes chrysocephalus]|uniref:HAT C-terminal dimerisation domain-containing protein n=1 Tax=Psylliodes chrysocephalus TaxID=3402493 RepID=A0A9P0GBC4_9CUCU|nr:unnamed protein product [Psylliodes chrysocephala]